MQPPSLYVPVEPLQCELGLVHCSHFFTTLVFTFFTIRIDTHKTHLNYNEYMHTVAGFTSPPPPAQLWVAATPCFHQYRAYNIGSG